MAGEVVNQTALLSTKCGAWRQVSAFKPPPSPSPKTSSATVEDDTMTKTE
jgi:hypothetical protein